MQNDYRHIIRHICLIIILPFLAACRDSKADYVIEGTMPSNAYDGEWIYLAPAQGASRGLIDSTLVTNGHFRLNGHGEAMRVIRTRILLRLKFQELLVVTEPGRILVRVDSTGSVTGTPQNDALQAWKNRKEKTSREWQELNRSLKRSTATDSLIIRQQMDSLDLDFRQFHYGFLLEHLPGTLGEFLYTMTRSALTPEQQQELDEKTNRK